MVTGTATGINNLRFLFTYVKNVRISHHLKQVPLRKGWTKKVPGPSQFGTFHAYYSPTTGLSGGGKWGAEVINS